MNRVFVFGTLKEGFPNFTINKGRRLPGSFLTRYAYPLYLVGERHVPWLVLDQGQGYKVRGELYDICQKNLAEIDDLEQTAEPHGYHRIKLDIYNELTCELLKAYVYMKTVQQLADANIRDTLADEYTLEHASLYTRRD